MTLPSELRIGNWLIDIKFGSYIKFKSFFGLCNVEANPDLYDPIPLTPEILEKAWFRYVSFKDGHLYYCHQKTGFTLLNAYGKWNYSTSKSITQGRQIDYLHQLQNLYFALTGKELQIDL